MSRTTTLAAVAAMGLGLALAASGEPAATAGLALVAAGTYALVLPRFLEPRTV